MLWILIAVAALMFVIERLWPGQQLPTVRWWWLRILLVNVAQLGIVIAAGLTWDRWLSSVSLFRLSNHLDPWLAGAVAYFISTLIYYFWHRLRHESTFFWRLCHQIHHSPRRIEVLASFYKHPVEILINSVLSAAIVYTLLGLTVEAAAIYTAFTAVAEYFYHWNLRTPRWVGWLIQRPESHRVHHQFKHHSQNYADLPLWDWLFGTLRNPKKSPRRCGFTPKREQRFGEMLAFRDVHRQPPLPLTCFGCRKRWACFASGSERGLQSAERIQKKRTEVRAPSS
ncbi:sterol desaturase family protein [Haloferula sp. A504]|uniref:sterol desaturase family protein n=1 Tax=Haloferula sp. A504 TaxID=3373601 RepID=UPI0031BC37D3|nr:sterol desaturase family protein [Verrucomicrobiaceae bacterium E54]